MKVYQQITRIKITFILFFIFSFSIVSAQWVSKANALKTRSEVASVVYNGKVYAFFGFRDSLLNIETSAEVYDPLANTWNLLSYIPLNKAVTHEGVILIDDNVWIIGGRVGNNPGKLTSEIWIYNITNNKWSAGPQIKDPATGTPLLWAAGGAALLGRTLHIFGGFIINACDHDQDTYHLTLDIDKWLANPSQPAPWKNELAPMPIKRNHFGTVVLGGKIYALGGQFGHDCGGGLDEPYSHVYNPATNTWTELPLLRTARSHIEGGTFAIDGKIYVCAGQGKNGVNTNKVTIFDPAGNKGAGIWTDNVSSLTLPTSYEGLSAKVINNTFIIDHGGNGSSRKGRNTTYSRTLTRHPVYKLGFPSECLNLNDSSGNIVKGNTWLFTIDGTKNYTTSSNAAWLAVSKNATGTAIPNAVDIEVTATTAGLLPGNYNATITATGVAGGTKYTAAQLCVNLLVNKKNDSIKYTLFTSLNGSGTITKNPDQANYISGSNVTLTAIPAEGQQFFGWSGDTTSTGNPLHLIMNNNKNITATFLQTPVSISNIKSSTGHEYVWGRLAVDTTIHTDRDYKATSVPAFLNYASFIKTPNSDKYNKSAEMLSFDIDQDAVIYIAYDPRETSLPSWLGNWQKLNGEQVGVQDDKITYMELYGKDYNAGEVVLGGNLNSPGAGALCNYFVVVVPQKKRDDKTENSLDDKRVINNKPVKPVTDDTKKSTLIFKIYPNPGDGNKIHIDADNFQKRETVIVTMQDESGKIFRTANISTDESGSFHQDFFITKDISKGLYIIKATSRLEKIQREVIIK